MVDDSLSMILDPFWTTVVALLLPLMVAYFFLYLSKNDDNRSSTDGVSQIPWAPGRIPILGHALSYRKNPSQFLLRTCQTTGPIFRLNMAGKHMIIVAGSDLQSQIAKAPERILSARQAVADLGFEETLGKLNVFHGTDLHKGIIKGIWQKSPTKQFVHWKVALQNALSVEVKDKAVARTTNNNNDNVNNKVELFHLLRRVLLRVTIDQMIGSSFLKHDKNDELFLDDFMQYQDELEDVTAKAVVLPRWIALPLLLRPVRKLRDTLQNTIETRLTAMIKSNDDDKNEDNDDNNRMGFWLEQMYPRYTIPDIAEYVVGLLFAAHKNPAIGAAQSYLMLFEQCPSQQDQEEIRQDAKNFLAYPTKHEENNDENSIWNQSNRDTALRRLCLETLRLTAHSIGGVRTVKEEYMLQLDDGKTHIKYVLPKNASVGITHIASSLDPQLWGKNASSFQLREHVMERYQDEYAFTTFSHGVHKCPGQQLALVLLQCTVALLLEDYNVILPSQIPPLSFERATLAQRDGPIMVSIHSKSE